MFRKLISYLLVFLLAFSLVNVQSVTVSAIDTTRIWVSNTGDDSKDGLSESDAVLTLQKALSLAASYPVAEIVLTEGDYIAPAISIYHPNLTITAHYNSVENSYDEVTLYSDYNYTGGALLGMYTSRWIFDYRNNLGTIKIERLKLSGDNFETNDTIEDGSNVTGINIYDIDISSNISVENCSFENLRFGFYEQHSDNLNILLKSNKISAVLPIGIQSYTSSTVIIDSNTLTKTSLEYYGSVISLDYERPDTQIINNIIDGGPSKKGDGIYGDYSNGKIENNHFINLDQGLELDYVIELNIKNNIFDMVNGNAIDVEIDDDVLGDVCIDSNIINSICDIGSLGIKIYQDREYDFVGNGNYSITKNTISNFSRAIYFYNSSGIYPENLTVGGSVENENKFRGNINNFYCEYASKSLAFDLTHNDWGTEDEEIILSKINLRGHNDEVKTDYVTLDSTFSTNAPNEVWVDDDFSETNCDEHIYGVDAFKNINQGKSYVKIGGKINVADGVYDEQVFIFDSVSILGSGENTIVKNTSNTNEYSTVIPIVAKEAKIEGMNITGGHYGICLSSTKSVSSYLNSSILSTEFTSNPENILINNNFFTNQSPIFDYGAGFSIYLNLYDYDYFVSNLEIDGNKFENDSLKSAWAIYLGSNLKINNSVVQNNEIVNGYRSGLCLYSNGNALIQNNIFNLDDPENGIILSSEGSSTIKNNSILYSDGPIGNNYNVLGIYLNANGSSTDPENNKYLIENNTISGFEKGIWIENYLIAYPPEITIGGKSSNNNDLSNNTIALINSATQITIDASYNIWGVPDLEIPTLIMDNNDAAYYGPVTYLPSKNQLSTNANLSQLIATGVTLTPTFNSDTTSYSGNVDYAVERTTISAILADNNSKVKINNTETSNKEINLNVGSNLISVDVTAEDGITSKSYCININRDTEPISPSIANLSVLTASGITLSPSFNCDTTSYNANVSFTVDRTTVSAIALENESTVTINGTLTTSKAIDLIVGSNTISIKVVAVDGITEKTYTITIIRDTFSNSNGSSKNNSYSPPAFKITTQKNGNSVTNTTNIKASVSSKTAKSTLPEAIVDALIEKANSTNGKNKHDTIEIELNYSGSISMLEVGLSNKDLEKIAKNTSSDFRIKSQFIDITFDGNAVDAISKSANGKNIVISAGIIDPSKLSDKDKKKVDGRPVYDLSIMSGDTLISDFNGGHATVSIPYTLKKNENPNAIVVYYLTDDGTLELVMGRYDKLTKRVTFKTSHFSSFVIGYNIVAFDDVSEDAWYKNAVDFVASRKIANGTGNHIYNPDANLKRCDFIVLLMNAYQISPDRKAEFENIKPFEDAGDMYYTDYLQVAKGLGISNGIGNNIFAPEKEITRQEMFVMLYNALRSLEELPDSIIDNKLEDYDDSDNVASWAKESLSILLNGGIISGNENSLDPTQKTTRAEIAQVLYNLLSK